MFPGVILLDIAPCEQHLAQISQMPSCSNHELKLVPFSQRTSTFRQFTVESNPFHTSIPSLEGHCVPPPNQASNGFSIHSALEMFSVHAAEKTLGYALCYVQPTLAHGYQPVLCSWTEESALSCQRAERLLQFVAKSSHMALRSRWSAKSPRKKNRTGSAKGMKQPGRGSHGDGAWPPHARSNAIPATASNASSGDAMDWIPARACWATARPGNPQMSSVVGPNFMMPTMPKMPAMPTPATDAAELPPQIQKAVKDTAIKEGAEEEARAIKDLEKAGKIWALREKQRAGHYGQIATPPQLETVPFGRCEIVAGLRHSIHGAGEKASRASCHHQRSLFDRQADFSQSTSRCRHSAGDQLRRRFRGGPCCSVEFHQDHGDHGRLGQAPSGSSTTGGSDRGRRGAPHCEASMDQCHYHSPGLHCQVVVTPNHL